MSKTVQELKMEVEAVKKTQMEQLGPILFFVTGDAEEPLRGRAVCDALSQGPVVGPLAKPQGCCFVPLYKQTRRGFVRMVQVGGDCGCIEPPN